MTFWITVYNRKSLGPLQSADFLRAITQSDYHTLCEQYGLDETLIPPALSSLRLLTDPHETSTFFLLRYGPEDSRPLVVDRWAVDTQDGQDILEEALTRTPLAGIRSRLKDTRQIVTVELGPAQVRDMGLLIGYEIARWAAWNGGGIMEGLDGLWYRLNRHQAFLRIEPQDPQA
jgi:hypothetical protein